MAARGGWAVRSAGRAWRAGGEGGHGLSALAIAAPTSSAKELSRASSSGVKAPSWRWATSTRSPSSVPPTGATKQPRQDHGLNDLAKSGVKVARLRPGRAVRRRRREGLRQRQGHGEAEGHARPTSSRPSPSSSPARSTPGVVYVTDVRGRRQQGQGHRDPGRVNARTEYPIAALKDAKNAGPGQGVRRLRAVAGGHEGADRGRLRRAVTRRRARAGGRAGHAARRSCRPALIGVLFLFLPTLALRRADAVEPARRDLPRPATSGRRCACRSSPRSRRPPISLVVGVPLAWVLARLRVPGHGRRARDRHHPARAAAGDRRRRAVRRVRPQRHARQHASTPCSGRTCRSRYAGDRAGRRPSWPCRSSSSPSRARSAPPTAGVEEAAATLGASRAADLHPGDAAAGRCPSIVAGAVLCWARALGEFGATLLFGGNNPGTTQTLPTAGPHRLPERPGRRAGAGPAADGRRARRARRAAGPVAAPGRADVVSAARSPGRRCAAASSSSTSTLRGRAGRGAGRARARTAPASRRCCAWSPGCSRSTTGG